MARGKVRSNSVTAPFVYSPSTTTTRLLVKVLARLPLQHPIAVLKPLKYLQLTILTAFLLEKSKYRLPQKRITMMIPTLTLRQKSSRQTPAIPMERGQTLLYQYSLGISDQH